MVLDTRRRFRGRESREEVSVYDSPLSLCSTVSAVVHDDSLEDEPSSLYPTLEELEDTCGGLGVVLLDGNMALMIFAAGGDPENTRVIHRSNADSRNRKDRINGGLRYK